MTKPKKSKGAVSANIVFDLEDETLVDYMDDGGEPLPPFIKPKIKKKSGEKDYSKIS